MHYTTSFAAKPRCFCWIKLPRKPAGIADNYRVRGETSRHQCVCPNNAVAAYYQFPFVAHDCCALADPAPLLDANPASGCDTLLSDGNIDVLVRVMMVLDENGCCKYDIVLYLN